MDRKFYASVRTLKGIGPKTEELFHAVGIETICDLLYYFPRDYERYPEITALSNLLPDRKCAVYVRPERSPSVPKSSGRQPALLDITEDGTRLRLLWFGMPYIRSLVRPGGWYVFYGPVHEKKGILCMEQPQLFGLEQYEVLRRTLKPVYALTKGLTGNQISKAVGQVLEAGIFPAEYLTEKFRREYRLCGYREAFTNIHQAPDEECVISARRRFVFDEFFFFLLRMQLSKEEKQETSSSFYFSEEGEACTDSLIERLPYRLTSAQVRVLGQIRADLHSGRRMQRLVQGDVGSGKTIVAFLAMIECAANGYKSAMMVPTEVLAQQHAGNLEHLCRQMGLSFPVVLLTGSVKGLERSRAYGQLAAPGPALIIGTHALFQEKVTISSLALVITDEQHRFGVKQRERLAEKGRAEETPLSKGRQPHILAMSATPIPRTLAVILYGDLDISVIDEVPDARKPIKNCVVDIHYRKTAWNFILRQVRQGHQAYVVCPFVEQPETLEGENVMDYAGRMQEVFPQDIRIGCLHGRMHPEDKNRIMSEFTTGKIQILVSTTVIEVGMDVANATVMLIENAERFGLAQLHQLRGRVGRGQAQSYCILIQGDGKKETTPRLEILNKSNDGFYIASEDLKLRGPGDFFGIRQSGDFPFRIADIYQDADLLSCASEAVNLLLAADPVLQQPRHRLLAERLKEEEGEETSLLQL